MGPQHVKFTAPANVMEDLQVQEKYIVELVKEMATEMGIDPSEISVRGLEQVEAPGERRMLGSSVIHVQLHFTLASDPSKSVAALQSLNKKLAEPNSTLGTGSGKAVSNGTCTSCRAHGGQTAIIKFVCPGNMVRLDGHNICRQCKVDEKPSAANNACERCSFGEDNPQRQRICQCKASTTAI